MNSSAPLRVGLIPILVFSLLHPANAAIRPSFSLDYCSWHATDIALVEVTPRPGVFRVMESWKGDLEPGSLVAVPELQPGTGAMEIVAYPKEFAETWRGGRNEQIPARPVGSRMVLFLKKAVEASSEQWGPADFVGEIKTSVVWIDGGQLYRFQQEMNPGPSILVPWDMRLDKMEQRVRETRRIQLELTKVNAIEDGAAKAEGLKVYVRSDVREAQRAALTELGKCGPKAVAAIGEMLADPAFAGEDGELVKALAEAGGESVGAELDRRLQDQLKFWQATAPTLSVGWWNQDVTPHAPLRERYAQTLELVRALGHVHYRPALITAEQVGNLWRSLPQLNDASGLNQMVTECNQLVDELRAN
ncbi:MAG TPA: hypothetical protein VIH67_01195 [Candidatus Acidoferrum sp.]